MAIQVFIRELEKEQKDHRYRDRQTARLTEVINAVEYIIKGTINMFYKQTLNHNLSININCLS